MFFRFLVFFVLCSTCLVQTLSKSPQLLSINKRFRIFSEDPSDCIWINELCKCWWAWRQSQLPCPGCNKRGTGGRDDFLEGYLAIWIQVAACNARKGYNLGVSWEVLGSIGLVTCWIELFFENKENKNYILESNWNISHIVKLKQIGDTHEKNNHHASLNLGTCNVALVF